MADRGKGASKAQRRHAPRLGPTVDCGGATGCFLLLGRDVVCPQSIGISFAGAKTQASKTKHRSVGELEEGSPPFIKKVQQRHPDKKVQVWFQDETRYGQQGILKRVWAKKGTRPIAIRSMGFGYAWLLGAANPLSGAQVGLLFSHLNTDVFNEFLQTMSQQLDPDVQAVLVLDQAGWHRAKALRCPDNITLFPLPPYCPELNPIERLWDYLKRNFFSLQLYESVEHIFEHGVRVWQSITPALIQSICHTSWLDMVAL